MSNNKQKIKVLMAMFVVLAMVLSAFVIVNQAPSGTTAQSGQTATPAGSSPFTPSEQAKLITELGNGVSFPLGPVTVSLPKAINPLYTNETSPIGSILLVENSTAGQLPYSVILEAYFTGGLPPYNYTWSVMGATYYGQFVAHTFDSPGSYVVTVVVQDQAFHKVAASYTVTVSSSLVLTSTATNSTGVSISGQSSFSNVQVLKAGINTPVKFKGTVSGGSGTPVVYYKFGDANNAIGSTVPVLGVFTFSHTYTQAGFYIATIFAKDSDGAISPVDHFEINVTPVPLSATFTISSSTPGYPGPYPVTALMTFDITISGAVGPYTYNVSFGDSTFLTPVGSTPVPGTFSVTHSYDKIGFYTANLTVTSGNGQVVEQSLYFQVVLKPLKSQELRIGPTSTTATSTSLSEVIHNGAISPFYFNTSWVYGQAPFTLNITESNSTGHDFNFTVGTFSLSQPIRTSINLSSTISGLMKTINTTGTYTFVAVIIDAQGAYFTNSVTLKVTVPVFKVLIGDNSPTNHGFTQTIWVNVSGIQGHLSNGVYYANITYEVNWSGKVISSSIIEVKASYNYSYYNTTTSYKFLSQGIYTVNATAHEINPVPLANNSNKITLVVGIEAPLAVVYFNTIPSYPAGRSGSVPFTPHFIINVTGGNGTLSYILNITPKTGFSPTPTLQKLSESGSSPSFYLNFTNDMTTFTKPGTYSVQFILWSNTSSSSKFQYVNFTIFAFPPKALNVAYKLSPNLIYLETNILSLAIGPNNSTEVSINITGGEAPYSISVFLGNYFTATGTNTSGGTFSHDYFNKTMSVPENFTFDLTYTAAGSYNISVAVHSNYGNYSYVRTLVVVPAPVLSVETSGGNAPTYITAYGSARGGAQPYLGESITINGVTTYGYNASVFVTASGTYTVTFSITDHNGYKWSVHTTVTIAPAVVSPAQVVSARMSVYFNGTLYETLQADWNDTGTLNATFLLPNLASSTVFSVNVSYSYTLWVPSGLYYYNVYSPTPYNKVPMKLTEIAGGILTSTVSPSNNVQLQTMISGVWHTVNLTKTELGDSYANISGNQITIMDQGAKIVGDLNSMNATINAIDGNVVTLNSSIGPLVTTMKSLDANITTAAASINSLNGSIVSIKTSVGTLSGTVTSVSNGVANIETSVGNLTAPVNAIKTKVNSLSSSLSDDLLFLIVVIVLVIITLALVTVLYGRVNKLSKASEQLNKQQQLDQLNKQPPKQ